MRHFPTESDQNLSLPSAESSCFNQSLSQKSSQVFGTSRAVTSDALDLAAARSLLDLNYNTRAVECVSGQTTPTSPESSSIDQNEVSVRLASPSHHSPRARRYASYLQPWYRELESSATALQRPAEQFPKSLRSPIKFDCDVEIRPLGSDVEIEGRERRDCQVLDLQTDTHSFHSSDWEVNKPRRRLSYGEPLELIEARVNDRTTSFGASRPKTKWLSVDKDCGSWVDDTIKARASRPFHSEPSRKKSRLWLDLTDDDDEENIREAVGTVQVHCRSTADEFESKRRHLRQVLQRPS